MPFDKAYKFSALILLCLVNCYSIGCHTSSHSIKFSSLHSPSHLLVLMYTIKGGDFLSKRLSFRVGGGRGVWV